MLVALAVFVAVFIHGFVGFGFGLMVTPPLASIVGLQSAVPLVTMVGTAFQLLMLFYYRTALDLRTVGHLILGAVPGIPLGILALHLADEDTLLFLMGIVTLLYVTLAAAKWTWPIPAGRKWAYLFGLGAGVLSGMYNAPGLMVIVYGRGREWAPAEFKGNLQAFFFLNAVITLIARFAGGEITSKVLVNFGYALPAVVAGTSLGVYLSMRVSSRTFDRLVLALLALTGARLLLS